MKFRGLGGGTVVLDTNGIRTVDAAVTTETVGDGCTIVVTIIDLIEVLSTLDGDTTLVGTIGIAFVADWQMGKPWAQSELYGGCWHNVISIQIPYGWTGWVAPERYNCYDINNKAIQLIKTKGRLVVIRRKVKMRRGW